MRPTLRRRGKVDLLPVPLSQLLHRLELQWRRRLVCIQHQLTLTAAMEAVLVAVEVRQLHQLVQLAMHSVAPRCQALAHCQYQRQAA